MKNIFALILLGLFVLVQAPVALASCENDVGISVVTDNVYDNQEVQSVSEFVSLICDEQVVYRFTLEAETYLAKETKTISNLVADRNLRLCYTALPIPWHNNKHNFYNTKDGNAKDLGLQRLHQLNGKPCIRFLSC